MIGVSIRLYNKKSNALDLVASYGLSEAFLNKGPVDGLEGLQSIKNGETIAITDVETDKRIQYKKETLAEGIASMLWAPIFSGEEAIGVMRLYSGVKRDFPEDTRMLVDALAKQGGLAIQNASMYLALQNDKKSLEEDIWSHRMWF